MRYDAIIVGAGAAGGAAAVQLARQGLKVLVLERYPFPRYKPCAGGITRKTWNILQLDITELLRFHAREISLRYQVINERTIPAGEVFTFMVVRTALDALVMREAVRCGAEFRDGVAVGEVQVEDGVTVKCGAEILRGRFLIGADGANGIINRKLKLQPRLRQAFAIEANLYAGAAGETDQAKMTFDFGAVSRGYGWIFPKGDHLCVGLYTIEGQIAEAKAALDRYIKANRIPADAVEDVRGHKIPWAGADYHQPDLPVLLAGDAAGFVDALTGEGIYYAMHSGQLAAQTVIETIAGRSTIRSYNERLNSFILPEVRWSSRLASLFYGTMPLSYHLLKRRSVAPIFLEAAIEGAGYRDTLCHAPTYLLRAMQRKVNGVDVVG